VSLRRIHARNVRRSRVGVIAPFCARAPSMGALCDSISLELPKRPLGVQGRSLYETLTNRLLVSVFFCARPHLLYRHGQLATYLDSDRRDYCCISSSNLPLRSRWIFPFATPPAHHSVPSLWGIYAKLARWHQGDLPNWARHWQPLQVRLLSSTGLVVK
jgi:hypothetical protein